MIEGVAFLVPALHSFCRNHPCGYYKVCHCHNCSWSWSPAGTKKPEDAPGSSDPDPPKRGRGRPRGSSRAAAASSAAAAPANPAAAAPDTEGQHVAAPEPAGPAEDAAHVQGPQTRQRRTASVSRATGAAPAEADDVSTAPNADTGTAAVQSDAPRGSKVQSEAPKSRRGRSRSSSSVSQFKQVRRISEATNGTARCIWSKHVLLQS